MPRLGLEAIDQTLGGDAEVRRHGQGQLAAIGAGCEADEENQGEAMEGEVRWHGPRILVSPEERAPTGRRSETLVSPICPLSVPYTGQAAGKGTMGESDAGNRRPGTMNEAVDLETALPRLYDELKRLARSQMARERPEHTLQTTALVHEAWLRLSASGTEFENRAHFFAAAGQAMRRVLVDWARARSRNKRGGGAPHDPFDDLRFAAHPEPREVLAVDEALERLVTVDQPMAGVVLQRYFVGLSIAETAEALELSERKVSRLWAEAKVWLSRELEHER